MLEDDPKSIPEKITSQEGGELLFQWCWIGTLSFIKSADKLDTSGLSAPLREDIKGIDFRELLIAQMWSVFDFLQVKKFEKALAAMHGAYMSKFGLSDADADHEFDHIRQRYEEYRKAFRDQEKPNHLLVSGLIVNNFHHGPPGIISDEFLLAMSLGLHLSLNVIHLGGEVKSWLIEGD